MSSMKELIIKNKTMKTIILIFIISIIIRLLSFINRIILNRMLDIDGLSLYSIILPSIMLFVSIGSLSLNTSINQIVSRNTKEIDKSIIKNALYIALISSSISSLMLLFILKPLMLSWLKIEYYPLIFISSIPLIYLSSFSSILRGIFNGLAKVKTTYFSILFEQIFRISFQFIFLIFTQSIFKSVTYVIIAMSIGEFFSIIFLIFKLKNIKFIKNNNDHTNEILKLSIPLSFGQLISSFTNFLEPILLTFIYQKNNYNLDLFRKEYNEVVAFILPLITMFIFITNSLSPILIQKISHYNNHNNIKMLQKKVKEMLFFVFFIAFIILSFLYFYGNALIKILYNYNISSNIIKKYIFFFIFVYIEGPIISIMQGLEENKSLLKIILFSSIIKLLSILIIPYITFIKANELILISHIIYLFIICLISFIRIKKKLEIENSIRFLAIIIIMSLSIFIIFYFINQLIPL